MALQIYSSPDLAAKLRFAGAQGLAQGIDRGMAAALEGYDQGKQTRDLTAQYRIALGGDERLVKTPPTSASGTPGSGDPEADALASAQDKIKNASKLTKALRTYGEHGLGYHKGVVDSMGLPQLKGLLQRHQLEDAAADRQLKFSQAQAQSAFYQAHAKAYEAQAAKEKREAENTAKFPSFMEELDKNIGDQPVTPGAMLKAYKASGYSWTPADAQMIRSFKGMDGGEPKGLPIGSTFTAPDGTKYIGMGDKFEPKLAPHQAPPEIDRSKYPWIFDSSQDRYLEGLAKVTDPKEQDKIAQNRLYFLPTQVASPGTFNFFGMRPGKQEDPNALPRHDTEEAARRAGLVAGDEFMIWDKDSNRFRKAKLD